MENPIPNPHRVKVAILDDHVILSEGLKALFNQSAEVTVTDVYHTVAQCRAAFAVAGNLPELLLLDIQLPDGNGIDFCTELKKKYPCLKVIILTMFNEITIVKRSLMAGAEGYMLKNSSSSEMLEAITTVVAGEKHVDKDVRDALNKKNGKTEDLIFLTNREKEILTLIADGLSDTKIAKKIFLSPHTVRDHIKIIHKKLGASTNMECVQVAKKKMLIKN
ncbi:MAG: response regulator transcription factor [Prevotellaceae bacterium]|jgi:DNA-binding NarL/FixJ family response regulator|nr:response regulator transcription factor [Prevotellaceae bacterium]